MILGGLSLKGDYHDINQDNYGYYQMDKGFISVLSDGLGSKPLSQIGSRVLCDSAIEVCTELGDQLAVVDPLEYVRRVYERWVEKIVPHQVTDCYATMLVFVLYGPRVFAARMGDGFIGMHLNGQVKVLFDRKIDYFANETDCFTETLEIDKIETYETDIGEFRGGLLCCDGIEIGDMQEMTLVSFAKDFVEGYSGMQKEKISADILSWLSDWMGLDDKTIVYFISEGNQSDESDS